MTVLPLVPSLADSNELAFCHWGKGELFSLSVHLVFTICILCFQGLILQNYYKNS